MWKLWNQSLAGLHRNWKDASKNMIWRWLNFHLRVYQKLVGNISNRNILIIPIFSWKIINSCRKCHNMNITWWIQKLPDSITHGDTDEFMLTAAVSAWFVVVAMLRSTSSFICSNCCELGIFVSFPLHCKTSRCYTNIEDCLSEFIPEFRWW